MGMTDKAYDELLAQYVAARNAYYRSGSEQPIPWEEFKKRVESTVNYAVALIGEITDETRKRWFIDYGTMNGWGAETSFKYAVACGLHVRDVKEHPELHKKLPQKYNWRCWSESNCSCGLCSSCDSSD